MSKYHNTRSCLCDHVWSVVVFLCRASVMFLFFLNHYYHPDKKAIPINYHLKLSLNLAGTLLIHNTQSNNKSKASTLVFVWTQLQFTNYTHTWLSVSLRTEILKQTPLSPLPKKFRTSQPNSRLLSDMYARPVISCQFTIFPYRCCRHEGEIKHQGILFSLHRTETQTEINGFYILD